MAFSIEKTIPISKSCSAIPQNLSLINLPDQGVYHFSVIRKNTVSVASFAPEDSTLSNCRLVEPNERQADSEIIYQAKWLKFGSKVLFVISSSRGFQVFEADGVSLMYSHSFNEKAKNDIENLSAKCAGSFGDSTLLVGRSDGALISRKIPFSNSKNECLSADHSSLIDIATSPDGESVVSCDDSGLVVLWKLNSNKSSLQIFSKTRTGKGWPCVGISFWKQWIIVGVTCGSLFIFDSVDLTPHFEISAHFRTLTALDVIDHSSVGLLLTASEDTHFRIFALRQNDSCSLEVEHCAAGVFPNQFICGARFLPPQNTASSVQDLRVVLSSYESTNITVYKCKLSG